jgi:hypothetical protein
VGPAQASCVQGDIYLGDVRIFQFPGWNRLRVQWKVSTACPFTQTGLLLGSSPFALQSVGQPIERQQKAYEAEIGLFVQHDKGWVPVPPDKAWVAAYVVDASGTKTISIPRMISGAPSTPVTVRPLNPDGSLGSCALVRLELGVSPNAVDGVIPIYWRPAWYGPCGVKETGILIGPNPAQLSPVITETEDHYWLRARYRELKVPEGETLWVAAYAIDRWGAEFRSAPEQVMLARPVTARTYHVDLGYGVSPIFEHHGVVWALAHESLEWNRTRSAILRRFPDGKWEVITSLSEELLHWIRIVYVTPNEVVLIADDRVYSWRHDTRTWNIRVADYTVYFQNAGFSLSPTFAVSGSMANYLAHRVSLDEKDYLFPFNRHPMPNGYEASGVYHLAGSELKGTFFLPQPTVASLKKYRPSIARDLLKFWKDLSENSESHDEALPGSKREGEGWLRNEIGPHTFDKGNLWFGLTFYGGEGHTGIGGIGLFDPGKVKWSIHHHPLLVDSSITVLYPDGDVLWLGTLHVGEGASSPTRGLVRYNRWTRRAVSYVPKNSDICSWLITEIRRVGDELWVGVGANGISVLNLATGSWTNHAIFPNYAPPHQIRSLGKTCKGVTVPPGRN